MKNKFYKGPSQSIEDQLGACPTTSGVYIMRDLAEKVLYVGKAKNLRNRLRSYFRKGGDGRARIQFLVQKVHELEWIQTDTEVEALLLECSLIKRWRPAYNVQLKDDKTYPFLRIDYSHEFPRVYYSRKIQAGTENKYYGPYPNAYRARQFMEMAPKVFKIRDCKDSSFANRSRACLSYQMGQCTAPCVQKVSAQAYRKQVEEFESLLRGEQEQMIEGWSQEMQEASNEMNFERAAQLRDQIQALEDLQSQLSQKIVDLNERIDRDFWALWPPPLKGEFERDLTLLLLQFREGRLWGRRSFPLDREEQVEDQDFFSTLLLQYYSKNKEALEEVVLPDFLSSNEASVIQEGLEKLLMKSKEGAEAELLCYQISERSKLQKVWEYVLDNARAVHSEELPKRIEKRDALRSLSKMLKLEAPPKHMECIDVSHFQGKAQVASCVVFKEGRPEKTLYRRYKIKSVQGSNDFAALQELVRRRYLKEGVTLPDLLIIDGGKGQLEGVLALLKSFEVDFPCVGLAKARVQGDFQDSEIQRSEERFFLPGRKNPVRIKEMPVLKLVSFIRDEAHRFAITYHRQKRKEEFFS